jgi:hypothetical protein
MLRVGGNSLTLRCLECMPRLKKKKKKSRMHSMIEEVYNTTPRNDVKIILGDLNAKISQEE